MRDLALILEDVRRATGSAEASVLIEELLRDHKARWVPVGGTEGNLSAISNNADPVSALVERVTNAVDATLEKHAEEAPELAVLRSPRPFVEQGFDVPGGYLSSLGERERQALATKAGVTVRLVEGDVKGTTTVDVVDEGTGILPQDFASTILSIHARNKINKWYVVGVYGHGGSASLRFCDHVAIISRRQPRPHANPVGFTITKYHEPLQDERLGMWMYLVDKDGHPFSVAEPASPLPAGTTVRHFNYQLSGISAFWYGKFDWHLFDPVLPVWVSYEGSSNRARRCIHGSRGRLSTSGHVTTGDEFQVALGKESEFGHATVRYWLFKAGVENSTKGNFIDRDTPILLTHNGQKHSTLPKAALRKCRLPYIEDSLVIQVDCDGINDKGRKMLFTSNREQTLKEGESLIRNAVVEIIRHDEDLRRANEERQRAAVAAGTSRQRNEMRQKLAEMINRIRPGSFDIASGGGKSSRRKKKRRGVGRGGLPPLPTRPEPTFIQISNKANPIPVQIGGMTRIAIESDAPDDFLHRSAARIELNEDTGRHLMVARSHRDFVGGRLYLWVKPREDAKVGTTFTLGIRMPYTSEEKNHELRCERAALIEPRMSNNDKAQSQTDAPNIIEVSPTLDESFWKERSWTVDHVAAVLESDTSTDIYVSVANKWLTGMLQRGSYSVVKQDTLRAKYVLLAAFHAYLQHQDAATLDEVDEAKRTELSERELSRAAHTIVTAITAEGRYEQEPGAELLAVSTTEEMAQ